MKHKIKNYLKLGILLFGVSLILVSCQKDDDFLNKNQNSIKNSSVVINDLDFKEFLQQKNVESTIEKLYKLKNLGYSNSNYRDMDSLIETIDIDSSSIKQIIKDETVSYTFRIVEDSLNTNYFKNLVIQTDSLNNTNAYIIKYIPDSEYNKDEPFEGVKEITSLEKFIVCITITTYINHYLCDPGVEQTPENCDFLYTEEISDTSCESLSISYDGFDNESSTHFFNTSGGGGGGSGNNDNPPPPDETEEINTIPLLTPQYLRKKSLMNDYPQGLGADSPEYIWLIGQSDDVQNATYDFLESTANPDGLFSTETNYPVEALDFIISTIQSANDLMSFTESDFPGEDIGYPFEWWLDDDFVENNISFELDDEDFGDLTAQEKILVALMPIEALLIQANITPAHAETRARFGTSGLNNKSDAFRHAFFNAMNANDAGLVATYLFSNAHESEVPVVLIKEKDMDLFNNDVGINIGAEASIFVSDSELSNLVNTELVNGNLLYLYPLDFSLSPLYDANHDGIQDCITCLNGIISTTTLISTNLP